MFALLGYQLKWYCIPNAILECCAIQKCSTCVQTSVHPQQAHSGNCALAPNKCMCGTFTQQKLLTLWEPVYDIFVPRFYPKNSSFWLPYQHHSSSAGCARELFKGLDGSASLLVCTRKNFFGWGLQIFCEWRHKWSDFGVILAHVARPRAQPLGQSVSLKFLLELGSSLSLLSLWSTFLRFWVKSHDLT